MADVVLTGFDVSMYQAGAYAGGGGFGFGIAKLTEGIGYKDPAADRHMAAILAQPIVPGGYHFSRPDLNAGTAGAYAEADWFWRVATSYGGARGMLLGDDAESAGGSAQWCDDFRGRLAWRLGGYQALFYSFWNWMQTRGVVPGSAVLNQSALWFAWPDANGAFPSGLAVSMQQWGLTSVPGITGSVDANRFFGSLDQLRRLTVSGGAAMLDPNDPNDALVIGAARSWTRSALQDSPPSQSLNDVLAHIRDQVDAIVGIDATWRAQTSALLATMKMELDTVNGSVQAGQPLDLSALNAAVAAVDAHVGALGKHVGVDVVTGQST